MLLLSLCFVMLTRSLSMTERAAWRRLDHSGKATQCRVAEQVAAVELSAVYDAGHHRLLILSQC